MNSGAQLTRRTVLAGIGATAAIAGGTSAFAQESLRIGTSNTGSSIYQLGVGTSEMLREYAGINSTVEPVGGSAANVNGIGRGIVDMAFANAFNAYAGQHGLYGFKDPIDLRLLIQGHSSLRWLFVRKDRNIKTPKDLEGTRIGGDQRALPELRVLCDGFIEYFDLDASKIDIITVASTPEAFDALRAGTLDGAFMPFSAGSPQLEPNMAEGHLEMMQISAADRDGLLELLPAAFNSDFVPADSFSNQPYEAQVTGLNMYVIASPGVSDDDAYAVVKTVFEHDDQLATYHANGRFYTLDRVLKRPAIALHPGLVRYLEEMGMWDAATEAMQEKLLAGN